LASRETEGESGDRGLGSILLVEEYTATLVVRVAEGTSLLLFPGKILSKENKILCHCSGIFSAVGILPGIFSPNRNDF
jgi:hypothetical protein